MPLKAVLFDMDGVIVDTEPLHRKAYFKTFEDLDVNVDENLYQSFTGRSTQSVCETLIKEFQLELAWTEIAEKKRMYFKNFFDHDPSFDLLPGVRNLITHYYNEGLTLILASSAHRNTINWVFDRFDLNPYFKGKISGAELKASKPHPEIFLLAAQMADAKENECMVIEDSSNGILASQRAGIFCAAYKSPHSKGQDLSQAQIIVEQFSDLELPKIETHFS